MINKKLFEPMNYFFLIWFLYFLLRISGIIFWSDINILTIFFLTTIFLAILFIYVLFLYYFNQKINNSNIISINNYYSREKMNKIYKILFVITLVYIFISTYRFYYELIYYGLNKSLFSVIELRELTMKGSVVSQSSIGMLSTILSGFPIVFFIFTLWGKSQLSKKQLIISYIIFVICQITYLFNGGRNAIFISCIIVCLSIYYINLINVNKIKIKKTFLIIILLSVLTIFLSIFIMRDQFIGLSFIERIELNEFNYNIEFNGFLKEMLKSEYTVVQSLSFFIMQMVFYLTHSLSFLDKILTFDLPENAYYLGTLEFYPIVLLLNKFGFDFLSISQINAELPFNGNYTTIFVPMYYDFGLIGIYLIFCILIYIYVLNLVMFFYKGKFSNYIILVILSLSFVISPIYSFLSLGIALPIVFSMIILLSVLKIVKN